MLSASNQNVAPNDNAIVVSPRPRTLTAIAPALHGTRRGSVLSGWPTTPGRVTWAGVHPIGRFSALIPRTVVSTAPTFFPAALPAASATAARSAGTRHSTWARLTVSTLNPMARAAPRASSRSWTRRLYQPPIRAIASSYHRSSEARSRSTSPSASTSIRRMARLAGLPAGSPATPSRIRSITVRSGSSANLVRMARAAAMLGDGDGPGDGAGPGGGAVGDAVGAAAGVAAGRASRTAVRFGPLGAASAASVNRAARVRAATPIPATSGSC